MFYHRMLASRQTVLRLSRRPHRLFQASANARAATTLSAAIIEDHRQLEEYANKVLISRDPDYQERYGNLFTWELARHAVGEDLFVYPLYEERLGSRGKALAETDRKDHHKVYLPYLLVTYVKHGTESS